MADLSKEKVNQLYSELLIDPNFEKLELLRNQPNIFEVLKLQHYEIRHSNFLGWFLDPNDNHGIGDYFLRRFLIKILQDPRANHTDYKDKKNYSIVDIHRLLNQNISVYREQDFIDILIEFDEVVIVIENKIHASEGRNQLIRYKNYIEKKYPNKRPIFVYLTKYGDESSLNEFYIPMSYQKDVLIYLNDLIEFKSESINDKVLIYIKDYKDNLNKNVMKQSEANEIAENLYKQHHELFDFIINNKPDNYTSFGQILSNFLVNKEYIIGSNDKHYVRFTTKTIQNLFKDYQSEYKGWENNEPFLFEFYFKNKGTIIFKATTAPMDNQFLKIVLNNMLSELNYSDKRDYSEWTNFINHKIKRKSLIDIITLDQNSQNQIFEYWMSEIHKYISEIENIFISNQLEIQKNLKK